MADVDAKAFFTQEKVPQLRHSESVTRVYAQYWLTTRDQLPDLLLEFLSEVLKLWAKSRVQSLAGPHELSAQRVSKALGPLVDLTNGVPIKADHLSRRFKACRGERLDKSAASLIVPVI